jgi:tetratricopeptide (TPR) repeat protein
MARDDWFRRTTWTEHDRSDFFERLKRCRGNDGKAQYVRIQADHLAEAEEIRGAVELLETLFADYPEKLQLAQAHAQMAECRIALGQSAAALNEYRKALAAEKELPAARTLIWLEFPWFVARHGMQEFYPEARHFLEWGERKTSFPIEEYKLAVVEAFMAADEGNRDAARRFAKIALVAAERTHSGFRYHAKLGLVNRQLPDVQKRLEKLAHA